MNFVSVPFDALQIVLSASLQGNASLRAGLDFTLSCAVLKFSKGIANSVTALWNTSATKTAISDEHGVNVFTTSISDAVTLSTLSFEPMKSSQSGRYVCTGSLTSKALDIPLIRSKVVELWVPGKKSYQLKHMQHEFTLY